MSNKIISCDVRMYTMGTGDCFVLSFKNEEDNRPKFQLMIDCGVYNIKASAMKPFAEDIIKHTDGEVDALLITHEHQDHVLGFQRAEDIFVKKFKAKELWLPWTENDNDELVTEWKKEYGKKKKALAMASDLLRKNIDKPLYKSIYNNGLKGTKSMEIRQRISETLMEFSDLNTAPIGATDKVYVGGLKGMKVVKEKLEIGRTKFLETGSIIENIQGLDNIRIYVLGPPKMWTQVKKEHGNDKETYKHNKELELIRGISSLPFEEDEQESCPFDNRHIVGYSVPATEEKGNNKAKEAFEYEKSENSYRRIDYDWLMSASNLSLRLTRCINNLSAVLAIEFIDSGKVMLFTGDAEYGSWKSWHKIDWDKKGEDGKTHLTKDLLKRTVFYKVAHHMSHNGTAKEEGLELMTNNDLVAMATLDCDKGKISENWKSTMPNRRLIKDLLDKTNGRLIILNPNGLYTDRAKSNSLVEEIRDRLANLSQAEKEKYENSFTRTDNFVEYTVDGR